MAPDLDPTKDAIRTPTSLKCAEGNMNRSDSASSCSVRRSRRPQTRLEASCTRTGRPRETPAAKPGSRTAGEGDSRTARMYVPEESHDGIVPMNHAPGVDGVTWQEYETGLEDRLVDLHGRVHRGAYRALPSRRVYIKKEDGRQRPLGVATLEDQARPVRRDHHPQSDLRRGLSRLLCAAEVHG